MSTFLVLFLAACLADGSARADWRTTIAGAKPILPPRFVARDRRMASAARELRLSPADPAPELRLSSAESAPGADAPIGSPADSPISWVAPLVDRHLGAAERFADIAPELIEAALRIEPLYDPTRLEGPQAPVKMVVAAGTATMDSVFADRWARADADPNVSRRVPYIAMAWHRDAALPCDAYVKNRARAGYEKPALTAMTRADCAALARTAAAGLEASAAPVPIVPGWIAVPVFAAPMPGARQSSEDFWATRRADIARIQAELRERQSWHGGPNGVARSLVGFELRN